MPTNLDRLHAAAASCSPRRQAGRTYFFLHCLAGHVELGELNIIFLVPTMKHVESLLPLMKQIFEEHELPLERKRLDLFVSGESRIQFISTSDPSHRQKLAGAKGLVLEEDGVSEFDDTL